MSDLVLSNLTINGRQVGLFEFQPDPTYPEMNYLQSGYEAGTYYSTLYWWVPRTNRFITGEHPLFGFGRWGGHDTTQIFAVKDYSWHPDYGFGFMGKLKYQQSSGVSRMDFGDSRSDNYLDRRAIMVNEFDQSHYDLGYTVLYGGVQSFSRNPFSGDWMSGDEGHLFNMTIEDDDIGYIIGNNFYQLSSIRTCDCSKYAYYFTTKPAEFENISVGDNVIVRNWHRDGMITGNMLHSSQSNFGWWWEVN